MPAITRTQSKNFEQNRLAESQAQTQKQPQQEESFTQNEGDTSLSSRSATNAQTQAANISGDGSSDSFSDYEPRVEQVKPPKRRRTSFNQEEFTENLFKQFEARFQKREEEYKKEIQELRAQLEKSQKSDGEGMEEGEISESARTQQPWESVVEQKFSAQISNPNPPTQPNPTNLQPTSADLPGSSTAPNHQSGYSNNLPNSYSGYSNNLPNSYPGHSNNLPNSYPSHSNNLPNSYSGHNLPHNPHAPVNQTDSANNLPTAVQPIDELDEEGWRSQAKLNLARNPDQAVNFTGSFFSNTSGQMEEGVYKNMFIKESWIQQCVNPSQMMSAGSHTLSFRTVEIMINEKAEIVESPKVAISKGLNFNDV